MTSLFHLGESHSDWLFAILDRRKRQRRAGVSCGGHRIRRATPTEMVEASISATDFPTGAHVYALVWFGDTPAASSTKHMRFFSADAGVRVNLAKAHDIGAELDEVLSKHKSPALINRLLFDGSPNPKWERSNYFLNVTTGK